MKNRGFIALTLTLVVGGTLLAFIGMRSMSTGIFFDLALKKKYRAMNYHNALNCIDQAILALSKDFFLTLDVPKEIADLKCSILSISSESNIRKIRARGNFQKAYVFKSATVRLYDDHLDVIQIE